MPQNKNLTQIRLSERGFGGRNGAEHEREKAASARGGQPVSRSGDEKREIRDTGRAGRVHENEQKIPRPRPGQRREDEGGAENRRRKTTEGRRQEADPLGRVHRRPAEMVPERGHHVHPLQALPQERQLPRGAEKQLPRPQLRRLPAFLRRRGTGRACQGLPLPVSAAELFHPDTETPEQDKGWRES